MVRAGILRSAIGVIMACLDPRDSRGNRASVGQILGILKDTQLVAVFPGPGTSEAFCAAALQQAQDDHSALVDSDLFERGRRFRNDAIAHILIPDDPTPTVAYDTVYRLHDAAEGLVMNLYRACDRGRPEFLDHQADLIRHAKVFWDTYFSGMQSEAG